MFLADLSCDMRNACDANLSANDCNCVSFRCGLLYEWEWEGDCDDTGDSDGDVLVNDDDAVVEVD